MNDEPKFQIEVFSPRADEWYYTTGYDTLEEAVTDAEDMKRTSFGVRIINNSDIVWEN